jgi:NAD(P)-dependent dehydrogenase (short-subunit alcohol dehydrogenase family)
MTGSLKDQTVLVIGRGSGLARAIVLAARDEGAQVVAAGRDQEALAPGAADGQGRLVRHLLRRRRGQDRRWYDGGGDYQRRRRPLARSLALELELAPIRVNAISPGVIGTGAWDAFGTQGRLTTWPTSAPETRRAVLAP